MNDSARRAAALARTLQASAPLHRRPPDEGGSPQSEQVLAHSLVKGTRGYIECIVKQINGTYEKGWYDSCAVMIRRLLETLIIEAFEHHKRVTAIQNPAGDFFYLRDLIQATLAESAWNLGRNVKSALPRLKDIGDKSAHSRRYVAHRNWYQRKIVCNRTAIGL